MYLKDYSEEDQKMILEKIRDNKVISVGLDQDENFSPDEQGFIRVDWRTVYEAEKLV